MGTTFGEALASLRSRRGLSHAALGAAVNYSGKYMWDLEHGRKLPRPPLAAALDKALGAGGHLAALAEPPAGDDSDVFELARRVEASDVGNVALAGLEAVVDELAVAYQGTPPRELLPQIRTHLRYVAELVDKRATLTQRRRLLVIGGWLSLLAATVNIDLHRRAAAAAHLATAVALAEHAGHTEIAAWCLETQAWDAVTEGDYRLAVDLAQAGQRVAPHGSSAMIQATAQEGRAWARLGDRRTTVHALDRVERLVSPRPAPDRAEHHYQYDPAKQHAYTATTLAWVGDPAAEGYAREVLARLESGVDGGPRPRRIASARLDLSLALLAAGRADEAAGETMRALESGRIVPSNAWRASEIVERVTTIGLPEASELREALNTIR